MHAEKIYISPKVCLDARCEKTNLNIKSWSNTFEHSLIARNDFSGFHDGCGPTGANSDICPRFGRKCVQMYPNFGSMAGPRLPVRDKYEAYGMTHTV